MTNYTRGKWAWN